MKQKFIDAHMKAAEVYADLSSARRLHVGCVIVKDDTIIGIGYNGMPTGWDNNCEEEIKWPTGEIQFLKSKPEVLHAETNAIAKVAKSTNSCDGAALFVTHAPCLDCAKLIYQSGIKSVFYKNDYKNTEGVDFLKQCNVQVENMTKVYESSVLEICDNGDAIIELPDDLLKEVGWTTGDKLSIDDVDGKIILKKVDNV